ncbi:MAG TPA: hypothetical protein VMF91_26895 [Bryobacteraceae bacterium]|nr:hypothetical protein [Bryobacteraceae bacterium]
MTFDYLALGRHDYLDYPKSRDNPTLRTVQFACSQCTSDSRELAFLEAVDFNAMQPISPCQSLRPAISLTAASISTYAAFLSTRHPEQSLGPDIRVLLGCVAA